MARSGCVGEASASWDGYRPGVVLFSPAGAVIDTLPLGAWSQVWAWFRDPASRPLRYRDEVGGVSAIDRSAVGLVMRRDVDACVVLEARAQERTWREDGG